MLMPAAVQQLPIEQLGGAQAEIGAQSQNQKSARSTGFRNILDNFLKWSATPQIGGRYTEEAQEYVRLAEQGMNEYAKEIYSESLGQIAIDNERLDDQTKQYCREMLEDLGGRHVLDDRDQKKLIFKGIPKERAEKIIQDLNKAKEEKFNEGFEELARKYYKNSLVDPLSKANIIIDASFALISGPQSFLGHLLGAIFRSSKAGKLGENGREWVESLGKKYEAIRRAGSDKVDQTIVDLTNQAVKKSDEARVLNKQVVGAQEKLKVLRQEGQALAAGGRALTPEFRRKLEAVTAELDSAKEKAETARLEVDVAAFGLDNRYKGMAFYKKAQSHVAAVNKCHNLDVAAPQEQIASEASARQEKVTAKAEHEEAHCKWNLAKAELKHYLASIEQKARGKLLIADNFASPQDKAEAQQKMAEADSKLREAGLERDVEKFKLDHCCKNAVFNLRESELQTAEDEVTRNSPAAGAPPFVLGSDEESNLKKYIALRDKALANMVKAQSEEVRAGADLQLAERQLQQAQQAAVAVPLHAHAAAIAAVPPPGGAVGVLPQQQQQQQQQHQLLGRGAS
jgi:hypothetical protein